MFGWLTRFFKKKAKQEEVCEHCGFPVKYHPWTDCLQTRAAIRTASEPASGRAKEFYDKIAAAKKPVLCACGCGQPLNPNHLQEQMYVRLADGKSVLINMSCWLAAYGENAAFSDENRRWPKVS